MAYDQNSAYRPPNRTYYSNQGSQQQYEQPAYERRQFQQSPYEQQAYSQPGQPAYAQQAYSQPDYGQPQYAQPDYEQRSRQYGQQQTRGQVDDGYAYVAETPYTGNGAVKSANGQQYGQPYHGSGDQYGTPQAAPMQQQYPPQSTPMPRQQYPPQSAQMPQQQHSQPAHAPQQRQHTQHTPAPRQQQYPPQPIPTPRQQQYPPQPVPIPRQQPPIQSAPMPQRQYPPQPAPVAQEQNSRNYASMPRQQPPPRSASVPQPQYPPQSASVPQPQYPPQSASVPQPQYPPQSSQQQYPSRPSTATQQQYPSQPAPRPSDRDHQVPTDRGRGDDREAYAARRGQSAAPQQDQSNPSSRIPDDRNIREPRPVQTMPQGVTSTKDHVQPDRNSPPRKHQTRDKSAPPARRKPLIESTSPDFIAQDNAFPSFPTKKEVSKAKRREVSGEHGSHGYRSSEEHTRPSTAGSMQNRKHAGSGEGMDKQNLQPSNSQLTEVSFPGDGANQQGNHPHEDRGNRVKDGSSGTQASNMTQHDSLETPGRSQPRPEHGIAEPRHVPAYDQQFPQTRPVVNGFQSAQVSEQKRPVVQQIYTEPAVPQYRPEQFEPPRFPQGGEMQRPSTSTDRPFAKQERGYSPISARSEVHLQTPWVDDRHKHESFGELYDHYYHREDPAPRLKTASMIREDQIEAEMPDFDNLDDQPKTAHQRGLTIDRHLNPGDFNANPPPLPPSHNGNRQQPTGPAYVKPVYQNEGYAPEISEHKAMPADMTGFVFGIPGESQHQETESREYRPPMPSGNRSAPVPGNIPNAPLTAPTYGAVAQTSRMPHQGPPQSDYVPGPRPGDMRDPRMRGPGPNYGDMRDPSTRGPGPNPGNLQDPRMRGPGPGPGDKRDPRMRGPGPNTGDMRDLTMRGPGPNPGDMRDPRMRRPGPPPGASMPNSSRSIPTQEHPDPNAWPDAQQQQGRGPWQQPPGLPQHMQRQQSQGPGQQQPPLQQQQQQQHMPNKQAGPGNPDALPHHPAPVRPGLADPSPPPPVRQHTRTSIDSGSSAPKPPSVNGSRASADEHQQPQPVTRAELDRLRANVDANPRDFKVALLLAKKLVEASSVLASENGRLDEKSTNKNGERYILDAHKRIKRLVSAGDAEAMFYLADCYGQGMLGLEVDTKEAFSLYQSAAKAGHAPAAYRTAVCCEMGPEEGGGTRKDAQKAVQWYRRAAQLNDNAAMYKIGVILLKGLLDQQKNVAEAVVWLKKAGEHADADNPHALHELGLLHEPGNTDPAVREKVPADEKYSRELYTKAANMGYKFSQFRLGQAYEYGGLGFPIDPRSSIGWYSKAAAQGEHGAELALSGWYLTGSAGILEHSEAEAYLWARKAALSEPPVARALFAMGYFSENGIGCPASVEDAKRWYGRAASFRYPKALERLEELRKGGSRAAARPKPVEGRLRRDQKKDEAECVVM